MVITVTQQPEFLDDAKEEEQVTLYGQTALGSDTDLDDARSRCSFAEQSVSFSQ